MNQPTQGHRNHHGQAYGPPQRNGWRIGVIVLSVVLGLIVLGFAGLVGFGMFVQHAQDDQNRAAWKERRDLDDADARARAREEQRQQQESERVANDKRMVRSGAYLVTSDFGYHDEGIINDYRQLAAVTVLNRSKYPVNNISGNVEWIDGSGTIAGSMPFSLGGSIVAGDQRRFTQADGSLRNGTIRSSATRARIVFTHVDIVE
jgi:hypothetical protein